MIAQLAQCHHPRMRIRVMQYPETVVLERMGRGAVDSPVKSVDDSGGRGYGLASSRRGGQRAEPFIASMQRQQMWLEDTERRHQDSGERQQA